MTRTRWNLRTLSRHVATLALAVAMIGATVRGCAEEAPAPGNGPDFDVAGLLNALASDVVLPTLQDFSAAAAKLSAATTAYAASLTAEDLDLARQAWHDAMAIWQRAEVMQVGPAAMSAAGGEDFRDQIYSWPVVNTCRVDQELVEGVYGDPGAFAGELVNVRGLDALEYLLFYTGDTNACLPTRAINDSGSWTAIVGDLAQRRADYAVTAAGLVAKTAAALVERWEPTGGDFAGQLATTAFASPRAALNAVTNAMFYVEEQTKDVKMALLNGLSGCAAPTCSEALESKHAGASLQHIVANLVGFQQLFLGGPPSLPQAHGFDDVLVGLDQAPLATQLGAAIDAALTAAAAIPADNLAEAVTGAPQTVEALHTALSELTSLVKADFLTVFQLDMPQSVEGDND